MANEMQSRDAGEPRVTALRRPARGWRRLGTDRKGVAALETAAVMPVLLLILLGIVYTGILFNNFIELNNAVRVATRVVASSRPTTSGSGTPYSTALSTFEAAAPNLSLGTSNFTVSVNGTTCSADAACSTALYSAQGESAGVTGTYPCKLAFMGYTFIPSCSITTTTAEEVQ
jgi:Flp pilus assembly protein TadG